MNDVKKNILTIPNILTFFRLLLIPVYAVLYMKANELRDYIATASVLAVSALTDMADGIIARKCNMRSKLGIMLDPFADKLTQGVIMLCLTLKHTELLPLLILFVLKEGFMFVMGCRLLRKRKMLKGALFAGKICTTVLFLGMIALVVFPHMPPLGWFTIVAICGVFMIISLVSYILCYLRPADHICDLHD